MTAFTRTQITNIALALIGTERVDNYTDDDASAALARDLWDVVVLEALETHEWRFASDIASLERGTAPSAGYTYRYNLPADFVRINSAYANADMTDRIEDYELRKGYMHASAENVYIEYVQSGTSIGAWPGYFAQYVAALLAFHIASTQKSTSEAERLEKGAMKRLGQARALDSTQQPVRRPPPGRWIRAVRGNYRTL